MLTQSLDSDIYDYGFILNSTALHEAAMSVLVTTIYGRWRGTTTSCVAYRPQIALLRLQGDPIIVSTGILAILCRPMAVQYLSGG